jgi:hypothetical protein
VACGDEQALAFRSELPDDPYYTEQDVDDGMDPFTPGDIWRHAQDCMLWSPLSFEPDRFAEIDEDWQARLAED